MLGLEFEGRKWEIGPQDGFGGKGPRKWESAISCNLLSYYNYLGIDSSPLNFAVDFGKGKRKERREKSILVSGLLLT